MRQTGSHVCSEVQKGIDACSTAAETLRIARQVADSVHFRSLPLSFERVCSALLLCSVSSLHSAVLLQDSSTNSMREQARQWILSRFSEKVETVFARLAGTWADLEYLAARSELSLAFGRGGWPFRERALAPGRPPASFRIFRLTTFAFREQVFHSAV